MDFFRGSTLQRVYFPRFTHEKKAVALPCRAAFSPVKGSTPHSAAGGLRGANDWFSYGLC